jgi:hypothetical protein
MVLNQIQLSLKMKSFESDLQPEYADVPGQWGYGLQMEAQIIPSTI